jgi:NADH-quinone oxidoreductase subunit E
MPNMTKESELVEQIVDRYDADTGMLIPILQDLQADCGYLPQEHLLCLANHLDIPMSRIYAVATFYTSFRLAPKGLHDVTLCMGTVCYLKGAPKICEAISREFQVEPGSTTRDRLFTLQAVNCVGACALAPVMIVDGQYYDAVTPESALEVLHELSPAEEAAESTAKEAES